VIAPASAAAAVPTASPTATAAEPAAAAATTARLSAAEPRHVLRGGALLPLHDVELDALAFVERLEAAALNGRVVHEQVFAAVLGRDEAEALVVVEPLHCAFRAHRTGLPAERGWLCRARTRRARRGRRLRRVRGARRLASRPGCCSDPRRGDPAVAQRGGPRRVPGAPQLRP